MTEPDIAVRLAVLNEAAEISGVLLQAFVDYAPMSTPEAFAATTPAADQVAKRFAEGPIWVAVRGGALVGTVSAVLSGQALYIRSMAVLPIARGLGLGTLLLKRAETFGKEQGCERLFLSTSPFLIQAIRLYESFGFRRTSKGPQTLFGTPLFTMAKTL